jgi:energy-coupling factor transport system permease protein
MELVCLVGILAIARAIGTSQVASMMLSRFALTLFVMIVLLQVVFTRTGTELLSIPLYVTRLGVTDDGLRIGFVSALRFLTVILISALFIVSTDPVALVYSLMRAGIPYRYGFMVILMMRFASVFALEVKTVCNAQKMRGLQIDEAGLKGLLRSIRYTIVPLIVSALSRVDGLVVSMEGRAFGYGKTRTFVVQDRYSYFDKALILFSSMAVLLTLAGAAVGLYPLIQTMPWMRPV